MIRISNLTKRYGGTTAVDGLTVEVLPGRVTGFLGPNGAGKSTTLRLILGLDTPTSGSATIDGRPFRGLRRPLLRVGALLDAGAVPAGRSADRHLTALARSNGIPVRRVADVLDEVGLTAVARKRVGGFSLGMRQRLGIAAALLGDPDVLIFDEPVNGLDPEGIHWVRSFFRRLAGEGRTVLVSSHLMSEMEHTADQLIVIGRGRLIADMSVTEFVERGARRHVAVRTPDGGAFARLLTGEGASVADGGDGVLEVAGLTAARIGDLALAHRIAVHELTPRNATLEEAFMEITADSVDHHAEPEETTR
ncbi:ABC transporter ATP-binding protein [Actinoallomurus soli]|uniref:ABC transporter ATP-binding protein n=1 Tax=Actinoallomurus soli TaxID=2952535 RepID=UPI002092DE9C|nr:ATP-binding cassette domain-containing protein [Actinoallomurus soli]MCO5974173.1 ATP-binding cassette domain-containing protein [Actinoallomurus soli]